MREVIYRLSLTNERLSVWNFFPTASDAEICSDVLSRTDYQRSFLKDHLVRLYRSEIQSNKMFVTRTVLNLKQPYTITTNWSVSYSFLSIKLSCYFTGNWRRNYVSKSFPNLVAARPLPDRSVLIKCMEGSLIFALEDSKCQISESISSSGSIFGFLFADRRTVLSLRSKNL